MIWLRTHTPEGVPFAIVAAEPPPTLGRDVIRAAHAHRRDATTTPPPDAATTGADSNGWWRRGSDATTTRPAHYSSSSSSNDAATTPPPPAATTGSPDAATTAPEPWPTQRQAGVAARLRAMGIEPVADIVQHLAALPALQEAEAWHRIETYRDPGNPTFVRLCIASALNTYPLEPPTPATPEKGTRVPDGGSRLRNTLGRARAAASAASAAARAAWTAGHR